MLSANEEFLSEWRGSVNAFSNINFKCSLNIGKVGKQTMVTLIWTMQSTFAFYLLARCASIFWSLVGSFAPKPFLDDFS